MASPDSQQTWVPYQNPRDCSQGFCSLYCPQWCYIIFPPPPPFGPPDEGSSGVNFSPLVIAIIGILASAFLLVSYYTIVSKYCANAESLRRRTRRRRDEEYGEGAVQNEQWQTANSGLDEALIKSITVSKYKRGDGLVKEADCSVCLSEFQEDESLRLLPKCSHAFHVVCIDTWLKSHSSCPLCRACIVSAIPLPAQPLPPIPIQESIPNQESSAEGQEDDHTITVVEDSERGREEINTDGRIVSKHPSRALSDMGGLERDTIIEIREEEIQGVRRSSSMDSSRQGRISIADVLGTDTEDDENQDDYCPLPTAIRPSKRSGGEHAMGSNSRSRALHGVMSPISMKRSSSSGRFLLTRYGRARNASVSMLS